MRTALYLTIALVSFSLAGLHIYALSQMVGIVITLCIYGFVLSCWALNAFLLWQDMRVVRRRVAQREAAETRTHLTLVR